MDKKKKEEKVVEQKKKEETIVQKKKEDIKEMTKVVEQQQQVVQVSRVCACFCWCCFCSVFFLLLLLLFNNGRGLIHTTRVSVIKKKKSVAIPGVKWYESSVCKNENILFRRTIAVHTTWHTR